MWVKKGNISFNTIIKTKMKTRAEKDDYHLLQREEQVVLLRLRTGHNRLNHHMATKLKLVPSPLCPCGKNQTAEHILQACPYHSALRDTIWPEETSATKEAIRPQRRLGEDSTFCPAVRTDDLAANDKKKKKKGNLHFHTISVCR